MGVQGRGSKGHSNPRSLEMESSGSMFGISKGGKPLKLQQGLREIASRSRLEARGR